MNTENNNTKTMKLNDLLTSEELDILTDHYQNNDLHSLRTYLNEPERKQRLEDKGVLSDYLYYMVLNLFNQYLK
jgi:hypothetical protein